MIQNYYSKSRTNLNKLATNVISDGIEETLKHKESISLGLCGGTSVEEIYAMLKKRKIEWDKVHIFLVDERIADRSNSELIRKQFEEVLPQKNLHLFKGALRDYEKELFGYSKNLDFVVLSAGEDGHIASLFPNHNSILDSHNGYIIVRNAPKPPPTRLSASYSLLENSSKGLLLFLGEEKRYAYKLFVDKKTTIEQCPAKIADRIKDIKVITDLF